LEILCHNDHDKCFRSKTISEMWIKSMVFVFKDTFICCIRRENFTNQKEYNNQNRRQWESIREKMSSWNNDNEMYSEKYER